MIASKLAVLATVLLPPTACVEPDDVAKIGSDTYFLSSNYYRGLFSSARNEAISRAGEYCEGIGRKVLIQKVSAGPTNEHGAGSAQVTFRCLYRADPELHRSK